MAIPLIVWGLVALGGALGIGSSGCTETPAPRGPIAKPEDDDGRPWWNSADDDTPPPPRKTEDPPKTEIPPEVKPPVKPNDLDQDGYEMCQSPDELLNQVEEGVVTCDCNDDNMSINPGALDNVGDFAEYTDKDGNIVQVPDQNCDLVDGTDVDKDGHASVASGGKDCDDDRADVKPGGINRLNNKRDWDCDGEKGDLDLAKDTVRINGKITAMAMGDVDGDGWDDVVVSNVDGGGEVGIYFGKNLVAGGVKVFPDDADVLVQGDIVGLHMGSALALVDSNGDGIMEIIAGTSGYNTKQGVQFNIGDGSASGGLAIFKGRANWPANMQVTSMEDPVVLAALKMDVVKGDEGEVLGQDIQVVGDFNGDGKTKMVVGVGAECDAIPAAAIQGYQTKAQIIQNNPNGSYHFYDYNGTPAWSTFCDNVVAGDLDGDGIPELAFGTSYDPQTNGAGRAIVLKGSPNLSHDVNFKTLQSYPELKYLQFVGNKGGSPNKIGYGAGHWVGIGNVNGQGSPELLVAVAYEDDPFVASGKIFCTPGAPIKQIWDGTHPVFSNGATIKLNGDVYAMGGVAIQGDVAYANIAGHGLSVASDTDGDGANDLFVGAATYAHNDFPAVPVYQSKGFSFSGVELTDAANNGNQKINASAAGMTINAGQTLFGSKVMGGFDIDGDGTHEIASYADKEKVLYVMFGGQ